MGLTWRARSKGCARRGCRRNDANAQTRSGRPQRPLKARSELGEGDST